MMLQLNRLFLFLILFCICQLSYAYRPEIGDLYFQDLNCGQLCDAITDVTYGVDHTEVSHVAMLIQAGKNPEVIEAIGNNVHITSLNIFLNRSLDQNHKPRVLVARLKKPYQNLIPQAIKNAEKWLGKPYNESFTPNNHFESFYCSELIDDAFMLSNNHHPIFEKNIMTFKKNGKTLPAWQAYFQSIHQPIPEGQVGTNPGMLSRAPVLSVIYWYGTLRKTAS